MSESVTRIDARSVLGKFTRLDSGAVRIPAAFARTGVQSYRQPDGTIRREFRPPEEVFKEDAVAAIKGAPVTSRHPKGLVNAVNWKEVSVGHAESARQDGQLVTGEIVVNDVAAIEEIENGVTREVSCGYRCRLDETPGEWNGERYDAIQRDIKINHVALVPRGRAGPEVALRLDEHDAICVETQEQDEEPMADKVLIKLDGKTVEQGGEAHISHLENRADEAEKQAKEAKEAEEQAIARADAADEKIKELETQLKEANDPKRFDAAVEKRASLLSAVAEHCGEEFKTDGLSDRDLKVAVIKTDAKDFDEKGKSDDMIQGRFEAVVEKGPAERADGITGATRIDHAARKSAKTQTREDGAIHSSAELQRRYAAQGADK